MIVVDFHQNKGQFIVAIVWPCTLVMFHFDPVHVKFFCVVNCNILQDGPKLICDGIVYITFFIGFVAKKGQILTLNLHPIF